MCMHYTKQWDIITKKQDKTDLTLKEFTIKVGEMIQKQIQLRGRWKGPEVLKSASAKVDGQVQKSLDYNSRSSW